VSGTAVSVTVPTKANPVVSSITNTGGGLYFLLHANFGVGQSYGATSGGNGVRILGSGFSANVDVVVSGGDCAGTYGGYFSYSSFSISEVSIGGNPATGVGVANDGEIDATAPAGLVGIADVIVLTSYGTNSGASGSKLYTYFQDGPSISAISPQQGLTTGGNQVTISGSGFVPGTYTNGTPATNVLFYCNGVANQATNITVSSQIILTAQVPQCNTPGVYEVDVTTLAGTATTSYQYIAPAVPVVSIVDPNGGSIANGGTILGGTQVTISGANFTGATAVAFGTTQVTSFTINNAGSISTTTPPHAAGTVNVFVTVTAGANTYTNTSGATFTYATPPPTIVSVSPTTGSPSGGNTVTIIGSNLTGTTSVMFDTSSVSCPSGTPPAVPFCKVVSDSEVQVSAPAHAAGAVTLTLTTPTGSATASYTYGTPAPTITKVAPNNGPVGGGTSVTITGTGFTGATAVSFGTVAATTFSVTNDTTITATTPQAAVTNQQSIVSVSVTTAAGTGTGASFTYTPSAPTVTAVTPNTGLVGGGTHITITGTNFSGQPQVTVGGVQAKDVAYVNSTTITATTPAGTGTQDVVVSTSYGSSATSAADQFTYTTAAPPTPSPPTVTSVLNNATSQPSGPKAGGTAVTITGTNLLGASSVTFNGVAATNVLVVNATTITATTPPGTGVATVVVTTPGGTANGSYTYIAVAPTVTAISPASGTTQGGTAVTITGTNFITSGLVVKLGSNNATGVTVLSPTTIQATTPAGSAGKVDVIVTTSDGTGTGTQLFTYVAQAPPTVTGIAPTSGPTGGGTTITITGTNFTGATSVSVGGNPATFVQVVSATTITAHTPPGAAGIADVVVTTPAGNSATSSADHFAYKAGPTVTAVLPTSGAAAGGDTVTITGTGFTGATAVAFGATAATSFTVNSDTSITAKDPAGTGTVDITVTTPFGTSAKSSADQFTYVTPASPPTVTGVSPSSGSTSGGTTVTVTGTNFTGATAVNFGSTPGTSVSVDTSGTVITVTAPAGSGTVNVTVVTPGGTSATSPLDRFTFGKATTSLTLTSSPNPSIYGQPVTFTALVTGNAPTGTVTFTEGSTTLGTAPLGNVTATSATAVFTIATLSVGADLVKANYGGDANNGPDDPSEVTQQVNAPADSLKLRKLQLAVMPLEANTSAQAITGAIDSAIGAGFSGTCPIAPTPNGSGFTYCFDGEAQNPPPAQQARAKIDDDFAALGYTDLPGTRWSAPQDARVAADLRPQAMSPGVVPYKPPRAWLAWIDVRGSEVLRTSSTDDLHGLQGNAMFGLTRRFSPRFLIGVTAGYENFDYSSDAYNGVLRGQGFTGGGYIGFLFNEHLRFEAAGTWSDILVDGTAGAASGKFTGQRWLGFGNLTGSFGLLGTTFEPSAQVYTLWEHENAYTDSLGTLQPNHDFDTGRASGGIKASHAFPAGAVNIVPYVGLYGDYYFSMDNATTESSLSAVSSVPLLQGWAARANGGVTTAFRSGAQVSVGGELAGIGNTTQIWTVTLRGNVPF